MMSNRVREKAVRMVGKGCSSLEIHRACCESFPDEPPSLLEIRALVREERKRQSRRT